MPVVLDLADPKDVAKANRLLENYQKLLDACGELAVAVVDEHERTGKWLPNPIMVRLDYLSGLARAAIEEKNAYILEREAPPPEERH